MSMAGKCKIVRSSNGARKVCWGRNGKIKSNTRASVTAGVGATRRRRKSRVKRTSSAGKASMRGLGSTFVAKASFAKTKSGKLRKGCKRVGKNYVCRRPGKRR